MDVIFMGTPAFAATSLRQICEAGHRIVMVVTQPDRPKGRGMMLQTSSVKETAIALGLGPVVVQPEGLRQPEALAQLLAVPADLVVTAAYGQLLPDALLQHPRLAAVNVHASLLPRYRGAAPIQRAIMEGESETGVTIMHMINRLDAGDIIAQRRLSIGPEMVYGELYDALALLGAKLLCDALEDLAEGRAERQAQDEAQATYAPMLLPEDRLLDWTRSASELCNHIRAMNPAPGAETTVNGQRLKIWRACVRPRPEGMNAVPSGVMLAVEDGCPLIATGFSIAAGAGSDCLRLCEVQPSGKRRMTAEEWLRGSRLVPGSRFCEIPGGV